MSEEQKQEFLMALFRIMQGFVDLGFAKDRTAVSLENVLKYLIPEDTAHETVAPAFNTKTKDQR